MILKVQIIEEQKLQDGNAFVDFFLQVVTVTMSLLEEEECELKTKQQTRKGPCRYGVQGSEDDPRQVFAWDGIFRSVVSVCPPRLQYGSKRHTTKQLEVMTEYIVHNCKYTKDTVERIDSYYSKNSGWYKHV